MINKFKHTLQTNPIVLRQDDDESIFIEEHGGVYYPLIRVKDTVVPFTSIVSFNLEVGTSFLPKLTFSIDDDDFHFRETDFIGGIDTSTIFIGSAKDDINEPIKNDYLILSVTSSAGSSVLTFECELHVPKLYTSTNRVITGSSLDVIETVSKECGLGFTSNIQSTSDSMNWIQYQNNIDFIHEVALHSYIDNDSSIMLFIDQFANLCFLNIKEALKGSSSHTLEINPVNGNHLEEPINLLLTNNKLDTDNPAKISSYTPINNYGVLAKKYTSQQNKVGISYTDYTQLTNVTDTQKKVQLDNSSTFTFSGSENAHQFFMVAPAIHQNNKQLLQGIQHLINIDWSIQSLFMFQVLPIDIYNIAKRPYKKSTNTTVNLDELTDQEPQQTSNSHTRNEQLSGDCLILGITYTYFRKLTKSKESRLRQKLKVFKI